MRALAFAAPTDATNGEGSAQTSVPQRSRRAVARPQVASTRAGEQGVAEGFAQHAVTRNGAVRLP
jgi:hypothetical protein